ncbi:hypothetical protein GCM10010331_79570 [Streptomyces xanthochromogenes]|uniref:hypothetical protein n=1 Tax=Streptomyces xanthochromogenes TaxID=67384 RepID=UPI001679D018|nr:hypothetical protein [Streptomyces xanthochromogenes]GHB80135.1 hypothetical protein GCM10010331_79570 [Streptomyces xanthochromogenes]
MNSLHLAHHLTEPEREAIRDWLASSLNRPQAAKEQWEKGGIASLALGRRFSAVRLTEPLVYATAESRMSVHVSRALASALHGPVLHAPSTRRFYAFTPPVAPDWGWSPHAEYLGRDNYLGVPPIELTDPEDGLDGYWAVPVTRPGDVCDPDRLADLISAGSLELKGAAS